MIGVLISAALTCDLDCTRAAQASAACADRRGVHYIARENILCIDGTIDVEGRMRRAVLGRDYRNGLRVVARSDGGALAGAIDMAEHLGRFRYSIVVDGICASACGQFLFMGANLKIVRGEGVVAMHGGPFSDEQIAAMPEARRADIRRENDRFIRFYADRGINLGITNDFPPHLLDSLARGDVVFWMPKEEDYARFNVRGLTYCDARYRDPDNVRPTLTPPPSGAPR